VNNAAVWVEVGDFGILANATDDGGLVDYFGQGRKKENEKKGGKNSALVTKTPFSGSLTY